MAYTNGCGMCVVKPLFEGFSSNLSIVISGYGGLRTFMQTDPLFRRNGYAFAGTERHENGEPSLRYSVPFLSGRMGPPRAGAEVVSYWCHELV